MVEVELENTQLKTPNNQKCVFCKGSSRRHVQITFCVEPHSPNAERFTFFHCRGKDSFYLCTTIILSDLLVLCTCL